MIITRYVLIIICFIFRNFQSREVIYSSVTRTLRHFCRWQAEQSRGLADEDAQFHDAAVLVTRKDLCREPQSCDTLGLAQLGSICNTRASCAVIEDNGLSAAFTIAHELAHM